jgi:hypothetical protein
METTAIKDIVSWKDGAIAFSLRFGNYALLVQDSLYFSTFVASLKYAAVTTLLCLAIGYPFAYFMARARRSLQPALLMLVMLRSGPLSCSASTPGRRSSPSRGSSPRRSRPSGSIGSSRRSASFPGRAS